jgi:hypothetical protein
MAKDSSVACVRTPAAWWGAEMDIAWEKLVLWIIAGIILLLIIGFLISKLGVNSGVGKTFNDTLKIGADQFKT